MKTKDNGRKWMWRFLAVLAALQLYFVRELLPRSRCLRWHLRPSLS